MTERRRSSPTAENTPHHAVQVNPEVISGEIGDALVLVNPGTDRIHELRDASALLWRSLEAGWSLDEAAAAITEAYDVEHEALAADLRHTVEQLLRAGLLERRDAR